MVKKLSFSLFFLFKGIVQPFELGGMARLIRSAEKKLGGRQVFKKKF